MFPNPIKMTPRKQEKQYRHIAEGEVNITNLLRFAVPVNGIPNRISLRAVALRDFLGGHPSDGARLGHERRLKSLIGDSKEKGDT